MSDTGVKKTGNNRKKFGRPVEKICEQCGNESYIPKFRHQWHCRYCNWLNWVDGYERVGVFGGTYN